MIDRVPARHFDLGFEFRLLLEQAFKIIALSRSHLLVHVMHLHMKIVQFGKGAFRGVAHGVVEIKIRILTQVADTRAALESICR